MKKPFVIVASIIALIILAGAYLVLFAGEGNDSASVVPSMSSQGQMETQDEGLQAQANEAEAGKYIDYSPGVIERTEGTKVLFFHASWCPQCRALEADIQESGLPDGVTVIKVDFDSSQDLREKYGVTQQTTLVKVDDSGELQEKFVAYQDPSVESLKANIL